MQGSTGKGMHKFWQYSARHANSAADVGQGNEKGCVIDRPLPKKCTVAPKRLAGPLLPQLFKGMLMWLPPAPRTTIWLGSDGNACCRLIRAGAVGSCSGGLVGSCTLGPGMTGLYVGAAGTAGTGLSQYSLIK